jgi:hypothetical protein
MGLAKSRSVRALLDDLAAKGYQHELLEPKEKPQ